MSVNVPPKPTLASHHTANATPNAAAISSVAVVVVAASIVAEVVSELLDTEVYHWWVTRVTQRYQWLRVLLSNSVSVPVDNLIFALGPSPLSCRGMSSGKSSSST